MKAPISHSKDPDLRKVPEALLRAAENARRLAEQTGTPFITRSVAPAEISENKPGQPSTTTTQHYEEAKMTPINITTAEQVEDYVLRLCFDDGAVQTVDFKPFLSLSRHPDIRAYLEPEIFSAYRIEYGELVWGDYDLCFPIADLYHNQLLHNVALEAAA